MVDVPPIEYALIVNVGQVLERISGNLYPATTHRVLKTQRPTPRLSVPYFFSPYLTSKLTTLRNEDLLPELQNYDFSHRGQVMSNVPPGDLHEDVFGRSAWRGMTRSHREVYDKYYRQYDNTN